jgi:hypothetical protein
MLSGDEIYGDEITSGLDAARSGPASGGLDELDDVIHALEGGDITGGLLAVRVLRERLAATEPTDEERT